MSLFSSLFKSNDYLGVEIGTTTIKVIEIERTERQTRLKNYGILETYGYLERFNNALQTSSLRAMESEISACRLAGVFWIYHAGGIAGIRSGRG